MEVRNYILTRLRFFKYSNSSLSYIFVRYFLIESLCEIPKMKSTHNLFNFKLTERIWLRISKNWSRVITKTKINFLDHMSRDSVLKMET
jgi:uncharacterized membrane protein